GILGNNWLRALKRSGIADTGQELVAPPPLTYCKDRGVGLSKAVEAVVPGARLRAWLWVARRRNGSNRTPASGARIPRHTRQGWTKHGTPRRSSVVPTT